MSLTSYRAAPPRVGDSLFGRPGGDRLSRILRCSIIGAGGFHGRVRDGIGWIIPRHGHQVVRANFVCLMGRVGLVRLREFVVVLVVCVSSSRGVVDDFYACGFGIALLRSRL